MDNLHVYVDSKFLTPVFSVSVEQTKNSVLTEKEFSVAALRRYSLISVPIVPFFTGQNGRLHGNNTRSKRSSQF